MTGNGRDARGASLGMTQTWLSTVPSRSNVGAIELKGAYENPKFEIQNFPVFPVSSGAPHMSFRPRERSERAEESAGSGQKRAIS